MSQHYIYFRKIAANKANQPDQFYVRCAHKKWSGYLQRSRRTAAPLLSYAPQERRSPAGMPPS